jgi:RNA polymerase sigma-70 factor (ECF subfamily)
MSAYKNIHHDLIEACKRQEQYAMYEIYKLYYKAMYNTSLRIVNNTAEAEDIMQDSFLDAFQKIEGYKGTASFGSWLKRIVINNSLDQLKRVTGLSFIEEYDAEIPDTGTDEYDNTDYKIEEIKRAITQLADDYRVILSLYLLEGYDHEEIGNILGISNNTSRVRYFRAKNKLVELLQESRIRKMII